MKGIGWLLAALVMAVASAWGGIFLGIEVFGHG